MYAPVRVETGLALDDVSRLASKLFIEDEESLLRALIRVALPPPPPPPPPLLDDGLRSALRASAPKSNPNRLIISLPADDDGDGLALRLLEEIPFAEQRAYCPSSAVVVVDMEEETVLAGDTGDPVRLRLLHSERPE